MFVLRPLASGSGADLCQAWGHLVGGIEQFMVGSCLCTPALWGAHSSADSDSHPGGCRNAHCNQFPELALLLGPHLEESGPKSLSIQEFFPLVLHLGPGEVCIC